MTDAVNELFDRLEKIEESAGKMLDAADEEKKKISAGHEKRIADFDAELDGEYKKKLDDFAGKLKAKASDEIEAMRSGMKEMSDKLDRDYMEKQDKWVEEIFASIISV
ncbi:MAG: hypothetical protein HFH14_02205 [Lachnospiraceae bacterium]|nr:hypothetical protein [Lachnospiraceae bacterium]